MYELHQAGDRTYYVDCYAKVGIYDAGEGHVYFIDSGMNEEEASALYRILVEKHWKLEAVLLTHGHGDHAGGCHYLQKQTGCKAYGTKEEIIFSVNERLGPSYMTGGYPPREMCTDFLMCECFEAADIREAELPKGLQLLELPGHNFHMLGIRTDDDVVFLADSIYSTFMLSRYHINFMYDVGAFQKTLKNIEKMHARLFIPSHVEPQTKIDGLARDNLKKIDEISQYILDFCVNPISYDELIGKLFDLYGRRLDMQQYYLVGFTVHSYLSWLKEQGSIQTVYEDNMLCWRSWHA